MKLLPISVPIEEQRVDEFVEIFSPESDEVSDVVNGAEISFL